MKKTLLLALLIVSVSYTAFAVPTPVDRNTSSGYIQPLISTDYLSVPYLNTTSSTATSTFAGVLSQISLSSRESAPISSTELTNSSGWGFGSDQWSGDYTTGFTHLSTTTATNLTRTVSITSGNLYQIAFTISVPVVLALGYPTIS